MAGLCQSGLDCGKCEGLIHMDDARMEVANRRVEFAQPQMVAILEGDWQPVGGQAMLGASAPSNNSRPQDRSDGGIIVRKREETIGCQDGNGVTEPLLGRGKMILRVPKLGLKPAADVKDSHERRRCGGGATDWGEGARKYRGDLFSLPRTPERRRGGLMFSTSF